MPKLVLQRDNTVVGNNTFSGANTFSGTTTVSGSLVASGGVTGDVTGNLTGNVTGALSSTTLPVEATTAETEAVSAAESGKVFVQTRSSTTVTYTLPAAAAGLTYTFVCGHADSEILITPQSGDAIVTKIHAANDGTALAPAAGTGIKNTAGTNVAGDFIRLVALDGTTWYGVGMTGVWASQ
jgi:hypothetical protein